MRILIGSAGRRVYLVDWFEQALENFGIDGEVHVTDADPYSSAFLSARHPHLMPPYSNPEFAPSMRSLFATLRPDLFFSVNDYELARLSETALARELETFGGVVLSLDPDRHDAVHDKYRMSSELRTRGVLTPDTVLLSDTEGTARLMSAYPRLIVKDRYGSGSSGLLRLPSDELPWVASRTARSTDDGVDPREGRVVQPALAGPEFGIDVVTPLARTTDLPHVLARRKLRSRSGETDQALSAEPAAFLGVAADLAAWTEHRGLIDVDVIQTAHGPSVIDVNPRFGGGYPFSHLAGADVPGWFVAQLAGQPLEELSGLLSYTVGVHASKFEGITAGRLEGSAR